jgi:hypothetical protein
VRDGLYLKKELRMNDSLIKMLAQCVSKLECAEWIYMHRICIISYNSCLLNTPNQNTSLIPHPSSLLLPMPTSHQHAFSCAS